MIVLWVTELARLRPSAAARAHSLKRIIGITLRRAWNATRQIPPSGLSERVVDLRIELPEAPQRISSSRFPVLTNSGSKLQSWAEDSFAVGSPTRFAKP